MAKRATGAKKVIVTGVFFSERTRGNNTRVSFENG